MEFVTRRIPPEKRRAKATGGVEEQLTEASVMLAMAFHIIEKEEKAKVWIHPDGQHAKQFDIPAWLGKAGFEKTGVRGSTPYGGTYQRGQHTVVNFPQSGEGDVVGEMGGRTVVIECKGGTINSTHAGQISHLRRGLCEAVGLLMARPADGAREIVAVPWTNHSESLAGRMVSRCSDAGIEIALVKRDGSIRWKNIN